MLKVGAEFHCGRLDDACLESLRHDKVQDASNDDGEDHEASPDDDALFRHRPVLAVVEELADRVEEIKEHRQLVDALHFWAELIARRLGRRLLLLLQLVELMVTLLADLRLHWSLRRRLWTLTG